MQLRIVARDRNHVVGKRSDQELPVAVIDDLLAQYAAQPLHGGADHLAMQGERVDDPADVIDHHVIDHIDPPGLGIDRHMGDRGAVGVGRPGVREGAVRAERSVGGFAQCQASAIGGARDPAGDLEGSGGDTEALRRHGAELVQERGRGEQDRAAAHHGRARPVGAEAFRQIGGRAVIDADAFERQLQCVGGDLPQDGLDPLPDRRGADIDRDSAIGLDRDTGALARSRRAALDEAGDAEAMIASLDQPALQRFLLAPARLRDAAVEGAGIIAAVALGLAEPVIGAHARQAVRHLDRRDQIAAADGEPVEPELVRREIEHPLAEEAALEPSRPPVGTGRRLVAHQRMGIEMNVGNAVRA